MRREEDGNDIQIVESVLHNESIHKWYIGQYATYTKTISESDVYLFAGITGDFNSIHINSVAAEKSPFGERLVHGILITGLISAAIGMKLPGEGTIYMEQDVRFLKPVRIGDTVTVTVVVEEIINEQKGILKLSTQVENHMNEKVVDGYAVVKVPMGGQK